MLAPTKPVNVPWTNQVAHRKSETRCRVDRQAPIASVGWPSPRRSAARFEYRPARFTEARDRNRPGRKRSVTGTGFLSNASMARVQFAAAGIRRLPRRPASIRVTGGTILEAGVDRVDLVGGDQRAVEDVAAWLGAEVFRSGGGDVGDDSHRAGNRLEQVRRNRDAVVPRATDR